MRGRCFCPFSDLSDRSDPWTTAEGVLTVDAAKAGEATREKLDGSPASETSPSRPSPAYRCW